MDKLRDLRFVTPPFFFLGSLLLGAWLNNQISLAIISDLETQAVVAIGGVVVASLFPIGFVIAGISIQFLRLVFAVFYKRNYQISLPKEAWDRILPTLGLPDGIKVTTSNEVEAAITFDHEILHKGVHDAAVRLWTAFNIAAHSCWALILGLLIGRFVFDISWTAGWLGSTILLIALFVLIAEDTWREQMRMFEFQSHRVRNGSMPHRAREKTGDASERDNA